MLILRQLPYKNVLQVFPQSHTGSCPRHLRYLPDFASTLDYLLYHAVLIS